MQGLQGAAASTVTVLLMQPCQEPQLASQGVQQASLQLQQASSDMQQGTLQLQQGRLQQGTPGMHLASLQLQQASLQLQKGSASMQQGSLELQQASLEMQQGSLELQQDMQGSLELQQGISGIQQASLELQDGSLELQQALQAAQGTLEVAGIRLYYSMVTPGEGELMLTPGEGELEEDSEDPMDTSDPRDSTASPEELELVLDEEYNSGDNESVTRNCTYPACGETCHQGAKQRKPWMCKKHRNKMYKDKYKKKKSDQAMTCTGGSGKLDESTECSIAIAKQKTGGSVGDRPSRPTLLEQVLNQKRLSLLRSPEVVQFLQTQQQLLSQQVCEQRQPFPEAPL